MHPEISPWLILPFAALLACIAAMPLVAHLWWEKRYPIVTLILGAVTTFYYLLVLRNSHRLLESAHEYISFISVVGSLFVVSGGIRIQVKGESTPLVNTVMLGIGGVLANFIGTTGASMLLIRPYLRANKYRLTAFHVVFFIFIVSNVGGCLTPIGDPPLYLGYLRGVPFAWTITALFPMWLIGMIWLLSVFYFFDRRNFSRAPASVRQLETSNETWKFEGLQNIGWLALILCSLFIEKPPFVREAIMIFAGFMSWRTTKAHIHEANDFTWAPLKEVAILFAGIFVTMIPALDYLQGHAHQMGLTNIPTFYWGSGILSSVLDNAPTYLNFMSAAVGSFVDPSVVEAIRHGLAHPQATLGATVNSPHAAEIARSVAFIQQSYPNGSASLPVSHIETAYLLANHATYIVAISVACVFFGAFTYIGNGPNFMVKNIAQHAGAKVPSFFGYIFKYSMPILLPLFAVIGWLFFR